MVPETDAERVQVELTAFNRAVGPEVLRALTDGIQRKKTGWVRMHLQLKDGQLAGHPQVITDYTVDLDGSRE